MSKSPLDDNKRVHDIKLWLTDREFIGLSKLAESEDRKIGESARVVLRRFMFGNVAETNCEVNLSNSPD